MELLAGVEVGIGRTLHALLFPTPTNVHGDVAVWRPGIIHISRMVVAVRVERYLAELTADLTQVDVLKTSSRHKHRRATCLTRPANTRRPGTKLEGGIADQACSCRNALVDRHGRCDRKRWP